MIRINSIVLNISILLNVIFLFYISIYSRNSGYVKPKTVHRSSANNNKLAIAHWKDKISESFYRPTSNFNPSNFDSVSHFGQRGKYWVLYNYVRAEKVFGEMESVTYTTHSDFTFLDNLEPLLERWMGPVSIAVYSPGSDFIKTIKRIAYLRECTESYLVKTYVTFHLFFESGHFPLSKIPQELPLVDCDVLPMFGDAIRTYRNSRRLKYPVNVARNVAREMSTTHFVLASDIELYPSPNLTNQFLDMIRREEFEILNGSQNPKIFVLPIFEVENTISKLPDDKTELQTLLQSGLAVPFHTFVCSHCHKIPQQDEWMEAKQESKLDVFHIGKREGEFAHWEPIYIGTKLDPNYDERLSWEGTKDKMTQGYILCVLGYEFHILNNAFLVHRPGIKRPVSNKPNKNKRWIEQTKYLIANTIHPELKILYGDYVSPDSNCEV